MKLKKDLKLNLDIERLVALGCSLTKDNYQKTWADYLSEKLNLPLQNIAARGAGLDYLSKRLLTFDLKSSDLVAIMLPSADRFDWFLDDDSPIKCNAVSISSWQNGKGPGLVDLNGSDVDGFGFSLTGGNHRGYKKYWYKYFYSQTKAELDYWAYVTTIQNFLEVKKIKYFFTSAYDKDFLIENFKNVSDTNKSYEKILKNINFDNFIYYKSQYGFLTFCRENNFPLIINDHYPETVAHEKFSEYLCKKLFDQIFNK